MSCYPEGVKLCFHKICFLEAKEGRSTREGASSLVHNNAVGGD